MAFGSGMGSFKYRRPVRASVSISGLDVSLPPSPLPRDAAATAPTSLSPAASSGAHGSFAEPPSGELAAASRTLCTAPDGALSIGHSDVCDGCAGSLPFDSAPPGREPTAACDSPPTIEPVTTSTLSMNFESREPCRNTSLSPPSSTPANSDFLNASNESMPSSIVPSATKFTTCTPRLWPIR